MNIIRVNEIYTAAKTRSGKTDKGIWEMINVVDERGHNAIAIFVTNRPSGVAQGGQFRVDEITGVTVKTRKDEKGGWWTDVSVNASVSAIEERYTEKDRNLPDFGGSFEELTEDIGELPF